MPNPYHDAQGQFTEKRNAVQVVPGKIGLNATVSPKARGEKRTMPVPGHGPTQR